MVEEEESRKTVKQFRVEELQPGVNRGRSYSLGWTGGGATAWGVQP